MPEPTPPGHVPIAVTIRSGHEESYHYGSLVAIGRGGDVELAIGDTGRPIFGRSSNKPLQAVAMVRAGLRLPPAQLALVCASHSGTGRHLAGVRAILAEAGLSADSLANTPDHPLDPEARSAAICARMPPTPLEMNCSGKHAGMLVTCVGCGWARDESYLEPGHPLQQRITSTIEELTGGPRPATGIDGCGAPAHVVTVDGLARAFRLIAAGRDGATAAVWEAMTSHPFEVGGPGRDVTVLMEAVPGLMAKDGAEGVFAAALPDGRAVALKIADGSDRPRPVVMAAALAVLGVDVSGAAAAWRVPVRGHGRVVGSVLPVGELAGLLPI